MEIGYELKLEETTENQLNVLTVWVNFHCESRLIIHYYFYSVYFTPDLIKLYLFLLNI